MPKHRLGWMIFNALVVVDVAIRITYLLILSNERREYYWYLLSFFHN